MSERRVLVNENSLIAIGAAIREKNGTNNSYKPGDMAAAVLEIETGITPEGSYEITENGEYDITTYATAIVNVEGSGGEDVEIPVITGDCANMFANNKWNWVLDLYGHKMSTKDITSASNMFYNCSNLERISFDLNFTENLTSSSGFSAVFQNCKVLKNIPKINYAYPTSLNNFFYSCNLIRELPEDLGENWNWTKIHTSTSANLVSVFYGCYSLRKIPANFLKNLWHAPGAGYYYAPYSNGFQSCYNLDEICGISVVVGPLTSNVFSSCFNDVYNARRITFDTNEDGTPKVAKWQKQTIDLTTAGSKFATTDSYIDNHLYNSGRTPDKRIYNDETYQALKNDPDAYVSDLSRNSPYLYSFYNYNSAVETINSLPDTSAYLTEVGGTTNIIKFRKSGGQKTDGGAISNLTEAEIAVAAAKGWTVSLVD